MIANRMNRILDVNNNRCTPVINTKLPNIECISDEFQDALLVNLNKDEKKESRRAL